MAFTYMIVFSQPAHEDALSHTNDLFRHFESWDDFLQSGLTPRGFFLDGYTGEVLVALLRVIRHSRWWFVPVIGSKRTATSDACWLDAIHDSSQAAELAATTARLHGNMPPAEEMRRLDERILYFLYMRGASAVLKPILNRNSPRLYDYPVADLLAEDGEDAAQTIDELLRRGLLEMGELLDRTRHCRKCGSAHIHFLDVCPHCGGIDIRKTASLHCFSCGHVAPEANFLSQSGLACPKCRVGLRHIGVDYDRPMAQYACGSCHHVFIESDVAARCLDCAQSVKPDDLEVREVSVLALTARGRSAVRAGEIHETFAALDSERYVEPEFFRRMLDWMLATHVRHKEFRFSLMLVEFVNAEAMVSELGGMRLYILLDEFAHRLLELLRTSDITSRTQESNLWILLPYSFADGLAQRIQKLLDKLTAAQTTMRFEVRLRYVSVPETLQADAGMRAQDIMQQLQQKDTP
jgi:GGDEF domain-containing protein